MSCEGCKDVEMMVRASSLQDNVENGVALLEKQAQIDIVLPRNLDIIYCNGY